MTESEFWGSTPRYLTARQKAKTREMHLSWEQTRALSFSIILASPKKFKVKKPQDVYKFDWEQLAPQFVPQTKEQLQSFSDEADEILRITQPEVYKAYMEAKLAQNGSAAT